MSEFTHTVRFNIFSGNAYERGKALGSYVKTIHGNNYINKQLATMKNSGLYSALGMHFDYSDEFINKNFPIIESLLKDIHPLLLEEIQGFADGLEEDYKKTLVFSGMYGGGTGCSHFYTHGFHGHNYDDIPQNVDNQFFLIQGNGINASFGASAGYIGRLDGMNEKGLAISLSFGAGNISERPGIGAIFFERIILDKASNVKDALNIFNTVRYISPNNILISDTSGDAAVIEMSNGKYRIREAENEVLYCANSYLHFEMKAEQKRTNQTTKWREQKLSGALKTPVQKNDLLKLLTSDFPTGIFEPYFKDELGTLWSILFDLQKREIDTVIGENSQGKRSLHFSLSEQLKNFTLPSILEVKMNDIDFGDRIKKYTS